MNLERRKVQVYDLPIHSDITILRPEQVILSFSNGKTVDIGALCYLIRQPTTKSHLGVKRISNEGRLVQIDSMYEPRKEDVRLLITFISEHIIHSGKRIETIRDMISRSVGFVFWADQNKFYDLLNKKEIAKLALIQYTQYLKEKVSRNEITINSAARQQSSVITFLCDFFEDDEFAIGVNIIRKNQKLKKSTQPPSEDSQAKVLSLCENIFDGIVSFILEHKQYPHELNMPAYLNFPNNKLWIFPAESWFIHPIKSLDKRNTCLGYNYQLGILNTIEQIDKLRLKPIINQRNTYHLLKNAENNLIAANQNFRHSQRIHIGTIALNAFIILFTAQTGMNWSQILNLQWDNEFHISSTHQLFRTIKWRAAGKECSFEIPVGFMPRFKNFIKLRNYLLNNQNFEYLFFTAGERGLGTPKQVKSFTLHGIYSAIKRIDPLLPTIQSREWRAAKSDWLVRNTDISTTALILQNTEKTVLSSYIAGSESAHWEEISNFLHNISKVILSPNHDQKQLLQSAIGKCSSFGNPIIPQENDSINTPNCINPEGCLFCENYRIHVDETDIRKLLSCRYCIEKTAHLIGNLEEQDLITKPIFERINLIIAHVKTNNEPLVNKIMSEVEEGELDIYWARKLEMFMELDWII